MSANHQQMDAGVYLAKVNELDRLKNGDGEALRRAEAQARETLARMKRESGNTQQRISQQRLSLLQKLRNVENLTVSTLSDIEISTEQARLRVSQLQENVKEVSESICGIISSAQETYKTAIAMYEQARAELTASQLDPDYVRFAPDKLFTIEKQIFNFEFCTFLFH